MFLFVLNKKNIVFVACIFLSTSIATSKPDDYSFVYLGNNIDHFRNMVQHILLKKNKNSRLFNKFKKLLGHNSAIVPSVLIKAILLHIQHSLETNTEDMHVTTRTFTNIVQKWS